MMDLSNRIALLQSAEDAAQRGEYDEALGVLSRCLDLFPGFSPAGVLRGEILARTGKVGEAIQELEGIIRSNPENIRARILLTHVLLDKGDSGAAAEHLEFLGFMMPENDPALEELRTKLEGRPPGRAEESGGLDLSDISEEEDGTQAQDDDTMSASVDVDTEVLRAEDLKRMVERDAESVPPAEISDADISDELVDGDEGFDVTVPEEPDSPDEEMADEDVNPAEVVTAFVGEEESETEPTENEPEAVDIKTRTMARVYERQGMFKEALDILLALQQVSDDPTIKADIERIRTTMEGHEVVGMSNDQRRRVITVLEDWLEKVGCNSMN